MEDNLLLLNLDAGCYHDSVGVRAEKWKDDRGCYPLNWLLHQSRIDDTVYPGLYEADKIMFPEFVGDGKIDPTLEREWLSKVDFCDVMGGEQTALLRVKRTWMVQFIGMGSEKCPMVYRAVHKDDSRGCFIPPDFSVDTDDNSSKYTNRLFRSSKNKASCRRYVTGTYHQRVNDDNIIELDGARVFASDFDVWHWCNSR